MLVYVAVSELGRSTNVIHWAYGKFSKIILYQKYIMDFHKNAQINITNRLLIFCGGFMPLALKLSEILATAGFSQQKPYNTCITVKVACKNTKIALAQKLYVGI